MQIDVRLMLAQSAKDEDVHPPLRVRGAGPNATTAVGPYYFCSRCLFHDREGSECAMFLHSRCCAQSWRFLASVRRGGEPFVSGSFLSGETHTEAFELYKALVNEMKHKRQIIIFQLFAIFSLCSRHRYMQPASLGNVTPCFPTAIIHSYCPFFFLIITFIINHSVFVFLTPSAY